MSISLVNVRNKSYWRKLIRRSSTSILIIIFLIGMEFKRLLVDHFLENFFRRLKVIPGPIERLLTLWLCLFVMQAFEIGMFKALFDCITFLGVENKHFTKQIKCDRVGLRIERTPTLLVTLRQLPDVFASEVISNESHVFAGGCAEHSNSPLDLIEVVVTGKEWSTSKKLGKYTADWPDIQGIRVMRRIQDDLRSSVPAGHHILCQSSSRLFIASSEPEIAHFQITVLI